ncbi:MAG TPA: hypothetical protein VM165_21440, partial [Planctomycetaceae bacterium]|nr:hypothetical protein [Planctomycetaceae bacterium]
VADRPELSDVLAQRYQAARDFGGLDRTKPLGFLRTWRLDNPTTPETEQPADVIFLPVADRDELLKTITFETVTYQRVTPDLIAIDRPGQPYHVLFRDGYAWLGDDVVQLAAFASRRDRILREIPATAQLALFIDFDQIPRTDRDAAVQGWLRAWEPVLQRRDRESDTAYEWRRKGADWLIRGVPDALVSTRQLLITQTLNAKERRSDWTCELRTADDSPWAAELRKWPAKTTPLSRLDQPEAAAFGVVRGLTLDDAEEQWSLAWQVFGHPFVQRTAVIVAQGPGLTELVAKVQASGPGTMPLGDGGLRRVTLPATPLWLRRFIGWDPEVWLGAVAGRVWIGCGPPDVVRKQLEQAHALVVAPPRADDRPVGAKMRLSARDLVGSTPGLDAGWADQQLARGGDQLRFSAEATASTLTVRGSVDVGVLRVLGLAIAHELSLELDQILAEPPAPAN